MPDILIKRNHMEIPWHNYVSTGNSQPITEASLSEKASLIGRTGMMLLSCGTGAWRVRSSMNTLIYFMCCFPQFLTLSNLYVYWKTSE